MIQQSIHFFTPRLRFKHVLADEQIESLNVLNRDSLIEDIHRLVAKAGLALYPFKVLLVAG